ncbi:hypothetical protein B0H14DRAFT_3447397 [Mycena olivaceomarginata]|nr:hypothetical protein B0H14DRAFT_3447397 [Mycena olivaceomarginata]
MVDLFASLSPAWSPCSSSPTVLSIFPSCDYPFIPIPLILSNTLVVVHCGLSIRRSRPNSDSESDDGDARVVQVQRHGRIVDELLGQDTAVFSEVESDASSTVCSSISSTAIPILIAIDAALEHGSEKHRTRAPAHQPPRVRDHRAGHKSVLKALKGGKETPERVVQRISEPAKGYVALPPFFLLHTNSSSHACRAMIEDIALSLTGSYQIASVLPTADKDQRAALYECIRGHIVRGCKTCSKVIWRFDQMRAHCGY